MKRCLVLLAMPLLLTSCGTSSYGRKSTFHVTDKQIDNGYLVLSTKNQNYLLTLAEPQSGSQGLSNGVMGEGAFSAYDTTRLGYPYRCRLWPNRGTNLIPSTVPGITGYISDCASTVGKPIAVVGKSNKNRETSSTGEQLRHPRNHHFRGKHLSPTVARSTTVSK